MYCSLPVSQREGPWCHRNNIFYVNTRSLESGLAQQETLCEGVATKTLNNSDMCWCLRNSCVCNGRILLLQTRNALYCAINWICVQMVEPPTVSVCKWLHHQLHLCANGCTTNVPVNSTNGVHRMINSLLWPTFHFCGREIDTRMVGSSGPKGKANNCAELSTKGVAVLAKQNHKCQFLFVSCVWPFLGETQKKTAPKLAQTQTKNWVKSPRNWCQQAFTKAFTKKLPPPHI